MRATLPPNLRSLEAEAIAILRETAAEFHRPVLLFSGGKDSVVLLHLALKAFRPAKLPFPLLHIDTGHNFPELIAFRDSIVATHDERLLVREVQKWIDTGRVRERAGETRNRLQTRVLLDTLEEEGFDAAIGGARRDEERARAKERIFSHRDEFGQWDPKNQRPELWALFNGRLNSGEHFRVFPLSNWTEVDVWRYIHLERISLPPLYFAHEREVIERKGFLYAVSPLTPVAEGEQSHRAEVRFRTLGDITCTGAVRSSARTTDQVVEEVETARITERGAARADDLAGDAAMEDRKREGYF